jgi:hypothetical protein
MIVSHYGRSDDLLIATPLQQSAYDSQS